MRPNHYTRPTQIPYDTLNIAIMMKLLKLLNAKQKFLYKIHDNKMWLYRQASNKMTENNIEELVHFNNILGCCNTEFE